MTLPLFILIKVCNIDTVKVQNKCTEGYPVTNIRDNTNSGKRWSQE